MGEKLRIATFTIFSKQFLLQIKIEQALSFLTAQTLQWLA